MASGMTMGAVTETPMKRPKTYMRVGTSLKGMKRPTMKTKPTEKRMTFSVSGRPNLTADHVISGHETSAPRMAMVTVMDWSSAAVSDCTTFCTK